MTATRVRAVMRVDAEPRAKRSNLSFIRREDSNISQVKLPAQPSNGDAPPWKFCGFRDIGSPDLRIPPRPTVLDDGHRYWNGGGHPLAACGDGGDRPGEASGWREWPPPQFAEQSIFYPVVSEKDDATIIARDWNVKHSGRWLHDQVRGPLRFPGPVEGPPGGWPHHLGVLDPVGGPGGVQYEHRQPDHGHRRVPP